VVWGRIRTSSRSTAFPVPTKLEKSLAHLRRTTEPQADFDVRFKDERPQVGFSSAIRTVRGGTVYTAARSQGSEDPRPSNETLLNMLLDMLDWRETSG